MTTLDYVIDILLIVVIFRQLRTHQLTPRSARRPLLLLAAAGAIYLRPVTLGGNDLALIIILVLAGAILGTLSGTADRVWRGQDGQVLSRAVPASVIWWVAGMGFRFGFAYYAYHSGAASVASFSASHDITGAGIWTTALVLMAVGQVLARVATLQLRRVRAADRPQPRQISPRHHAHQPVHGVVVALDRDHGRPVGAGGEDLRLFEVGGDQHVGGQPGRGGVRRDGVGEVARRGTGDRLEAELLGTGERDGDDAVLEGMRRVGGLVLDPELA